MTLDPVSVSSSQANTAAEDDDLPF